MKKLLLSLTVLISQFVFAQNHSLDFDGVDDLVTSPVITDTLHTIEFWIKSDNSIDGTAISSIPFHFSTAGEWIALNNSASLLAGETISINNDVPAPTATNQILTAGWHHIAFTSNGLYYTKIYIDGLSANMISTNSPVLSSTKLDIGCRTSPGYSESPYSGHLDEIRIWKTVRTQTEIQNNMNTELTGNEADLILYYKMDNTNSACDIEDCNSNWKHGVRTGVTGTNNLPQYSTDVPTLTIAACGAANNCSNGISVINNDENKITLFPNPTSGETTILFNKKMNSTAIRILNSKGQKVFEKINYSGNQIDINITNLASGIYFIEIVQDGSLERAKLVKN